ncbi:nucleotidyltransferase family protein [Azospirillum brasilense]|nr:nucleotidyltransferase family protein [Azospirillum brasilense]
METMLSNLKSQPKRFSLLSFSRTVNLAVQPPDTNDRQPSRVEDYLRKSVILKQIMSNKAKTYRAINAAQNVATVAVSSLLLFFGFSGLDKVQKYVSWVHPISADATEFGFNLFVFLLFVVGVLHLVFRFSEKQSRAEAAVASLANLANEIEDMITSRGNLIISQEHARVDTIRSRYEAIAENIPANSDKEFIRAKRDLALKEARKPKIHLSPQQIFDPAQQEVIVSSIVLGSRAIVDILIALRDTSQDLYLGGGLIRNAVWDYLHGYTAPTPVDDVDVIYYNRFDHEKRHDEEIAKKLTALIPNVHWSVKNQARMHTNNSEAQYASLEEAIQRWPETATAVVVRIDSNGKLRFVSPHGFDDLLRLIVTNTPAFTGRINIIKRRIAEKRWLQIWPYLRICLPEESTSMNSANQAQ